MRHGWESKSRGIDFLLGAQESDGGWRRSRYGALRGGAALTAMSLYALSLGGAALHKTAGRSFHSAAAFLRRGLERRGCVACPDGTLDLPVYGTALALLADGPGLDLWTSAEQRTMRDYLRATQVLESRGFRADDVHLGGWDLGGAPPPRGVTTGTNVSLTAWALDALATDAAPADGKVSPETDAAGRASAARAAALRWITRCQNRPGDGGFAFSPETTSTDNKAQVDETTRRPRSYGTATCDGLVALTALDVEVAAPPRQDAVAWLETQELDARVPGFPAGPASEWGEGLWFYYAARLARVTALFADPKRTQPTRESLADLLVRRQRADGSWANDSSRMREDDPLIATPLAIVALAGLD